MTDKITEKIIEETGGWLAGIFCITSLICGIKEKYDWLTFVFGICIGYMIVAYKLQKVKDTRKSASNTVYYFFADAIQKIKPSEEESQLLRKIQQDIENKVQTESFFIENRNTFFNSNKLSIAVYKEIIQNIEYYSYRLSVAPKLLNTAEKHLKRLVNKEI